MKKYKIVTERNNTIEMVAESEFKLCKLFQARFARTLGKIQKVTVLQASPRKVTNPIVVDSKPAVNKACPCGSGKKFKYCCKHKAEVFNG